MIFDFSIPITWSDIINVVSTFVAVIAVVVAIIANIKTSKSIKYSLKAQEQSKNVDLFEKRVAIIDEIKKKNTTSKLHLELLFNDAIASEYNAMMKCRNDCMDAYHNLSVYSDAIRVMDGEGGYTSPMAELTDSKATIEKMNYPVDKVKEFELLCNKYQITYSESGTTEDTKVYNYKNLSEKITLTERQFKDKKKSLLDMMQCFVKDSISPVDKRGGNSI